MGKEVPSFNMDLPNVASYSDISQKNQIPKRNQAIVLDCAEGFFADLNIKQCHQSENNCENKRTHSLISSEKSRSEADVLPFEKSTKLPKQVIKRSKTEQYKLNKDSEPDCNQSSIETITDDIEDEMEKYKKLFK